MRIIAVLAFSVCLTTCARAEDWPQWMGPNRDNIWNNDNAISSFPEGGPKILWRAPVAGGYAGPAVANGKVYVLDFVTESEPKIDNFERKKMTGTERVVCLDEKSGKEIWAHEYPVEYGISYPAGPRCTPNVEGNLVYALGAEGNLVCLKTDSGEVVWAKDLKSEYKTTSALWGYASHPLIDGDLLICVVGGNGSHTVAFNKLTGKEVWRFGTATEQGYSPPTIIEAAGVRQLILANPNAVNAVDPKTGKQLWTVKYEATSGSIIMSPVQIGDYLFVGGYSNHNLMLKLLSDKPGAEVVWRDKAKHGVSPVNVQPFVLDDCVIGMDQSGDLMAFEVPGGERTWTDTELIGGRSQGSETAFLVRNKTNAYCFNEKGELVIANLTTDGLEVLDRAQIIEPTNNAFGRAVVWSAAAFANGNMYVRNDEECICVQLTSE